MLRTWNVTLRSSDEGDSLKSRIVKSGGPDGAVDKALYERDLVDVVPSWPPRGIKTSDNRWLYPLPGLNEPYLEVQQVVGLTSIAGKGQTVVSFDYPDRTYDIDVVETKHPVTGQIQRSGRWSATDPNSR